MNVSQCYLLFNKIIFPLKYFDHKSLFYFEKHHPSDYYQKKEIHIIETKIRVKYIFEAIRYDFCLQKQRNKYNFKAIYDVCLKHKDAHFSKVYVLVIIQKRSIILCISFSFMLNSTLFMLNKISYIDIFYYILRYYF